METIKQIVKRVKDLVIKIISLKGFIWGVGTYAMFTGHLDATNWMLLSGIMAGVRAFEKTLEVQNVGAGKRVSNFNSINHSGRSNREVPDRKGENDPDGD